MRRVAFLTAINVCIVLPTFVLAEDTPQGADKTETVGTAEGKAGPDKEKKQPAPDLGPVLGKPIRVAVYEFRGQGIPERIISIATNSMVAELRKLERVAAIGMDEVKDMLTHEENKRLIGCTDESCLSEIAGAMGVDELITGSLATIGESSMINVRRLKLQTAETAGSINRRLTPEDGAEFLAAIGPIVEQLYQGYPLRPGTERGVADEVALSLNPPPLPTWVFWATAGAAVGVGALGGGAALITKSKYDDYNHTFRESQNEVLANSVLEDKKSEAETWGQAMLGLLVTAGVLAAGAGLEAVFTDWHGYGEADIGLSAIVGPTQRGGAMAGGVLSW